MKQVLFIFSFLMILSRCGDSSTGSDGANNPFVGSWTISNLEVNSESDCSGEWTPADFGDLSCAGFIMNSNGTIDLPCDGGSGGTWTVSEEGVYSIVTSDGQNLSGEISSDGQGLTITGILEDGSMSMCAQYNLSSGDVDCSDCEDDGGDVDIEIPDCAIGCLVELMTSGVDLTPAEDGGFTEEQVEAICSWLDDQSTSTCADGCSGQDQEDWEAYLSMLSLICIIGQ